MGTLRRPAFSSPFSSKRFVVALCAAIAMVLGAMSVGAHIPDAANPPESTITTATPIQANVIVRERGDTKLSDPVMADRSQILAHQMPILIESTATATTVDPKSAVNRTVPGLEIALKLQPLKTAVTLSTDPLQIKVDTPLLDVPAALLPIGGIISEAPPLQGSQPPTADPTSPPETQQNTQQTPTEP